MNGKRVAKRFFKIADYLERVQVAEIATDEDAKELSEVIMDLNRIAMRMIERTKP